MTPARKSVLPAQGVSGEIAPPAREVRLMVRGVAPSTTGEHDHVVTVHANRCGT